MSTNPVKVKICGIRREQDLLAALRLGADAIGINFWQRSKRAVAPEDARSLVARIPKSVLSIGVFVNPTLDELLRAVDLSGIGMVQLHGEETPEFCDKIDLPVVKAIRVSDSFSAAALQDYRVDSFLLDSDFTVGGSGLPFDWTLIAGTVLPAPFWLAGGLTPENVRDAIRSVSPMGVDVASGVELSPGVKDEAKMERFFKAAKEA